MAKIIPKRLYKLGGLGIILIALSAGAQNVGIGTATPDNSARLHVSDSSKGMIVPRMTRAQRNSIPNPANGLLVFVKEDSTFYYNSGSPSSPHWDPLLVGNEGATGGWKLSGNSGTNAGEDFIGTTDNQPLIIKSNSQEVLRVDTSLNLGIGITTPTHKLDIAGQIGMNNNNIVQLADPVDPQDAVNKRYVDNQRINTYLVYQNCSAPYWQYTAPNGYHAEIDPSTVSGGSWKCDSVMCVRNSDPVEVIISLDGAGFDYCGPITGETGDGNNNIQEFTYDHNGGCAGGLNASRCIYMKINSDPTTEGCNSYFGGACFQHYGPWPK